MMYFAAFDASELDIGALTLSRVSESDAIVSLSSITATAGDGTTTSLFSHYDPVGISQFAYVSQDRNETLRLLDHARISFAKALQAAVRAELTTESWPSPSAFAVSCDPLTGIYTIDYPGFAFEYTLSAAGARLLGLPSASSSPADSFEGTAVAEFAIEPTLDATSLSSPDYEPSGIGTRVYADSGDGFGTDRQTSPLYRDWTQQYELKAKTIRRASVSSHPWTFQDLFEVTRATRSFIVVNGFGEVGAEAFSFRSEGARWRPERASPGNDAQFHISFQAVVEGTVSEHSW